MRLMGEGQVGVEATLQDVKICKTIIPGLKGRETLGLMSTLCTIQYVAQWTGDDLV